MNKFIDTKDNKRKKGKDSNSTIAAIYTFSLCIFLILGSISLSPASINSHVPKAFAVEELDIQTIDIHHMRKVS